MSVIAKQSTARTVIVGPILDADGVAVTGAVVGDLKIAKNGGAPAGLNASATLTHRNTGHYSLALTASDTDTVGQAEIVIDSTTNAMPVKVITVVEETVYDALFAAGAAGKLGVNVIEISGDATAADNAEADYDGTGYNKSNSTIGTCTTNTDMRGTDSALTSLGSNAPAGWINAAAIAASALDGKGDWNTITPLTTLGTNAPAGWINAAAIAASALNGKGDWNTTTPPTVGQIADQVWDEAMADHTGGTTTGGTLNGLVGSGPTGPGAVSFTYTCKDSGGTAIADVEVWVTSDAAGTNQVAGTLITDASGQVTFTLNTGTQYLWRQKSGVNFTNPVSFDPEASA